MTTTAAQARAWTGPALFSYGFRPSFLFGAAWAAIAMVLCIVMLSGALSLPTAFDPVSWHAHEFLFGYLGALALAASVALRLAAGIWPEPMLYHAAGAAWTLAFAGFAAIYGPMLAAPRTGGRA